MLILYVLFCGWTHAFMCVLWLQLTIIYIIEYIHYKLIDCSLNNISDNCNKCLTVQNPKDLQLL